MVRYETSHLGAIPCLISCLPRMLHVSAKTDVKTFDVKLKKSATDSRAFVLVLKGQSLLILGLCGTGKNVSVTVRLLYLHFIIQNPLYNDIRNETEFVIT